MVNEKECVIEIREPDLTLNGVEGQSVTKCDAKNGIDNQKCNCVAIDFVLKCQLGKIKTIFIF